MQHITHCNICFLLSWGIKYHSGAMLFDLLYRFIFNFNTSLVVVFYDWLYPNRQMNEICLLAELHVKLYLLSMNVIINSFFSRTWSLSTAMNNERILAYSSISLIFFFLKWQISREWSTVKQDWGSSRFCNYLYCRTPTHSGWVFCVEYEVRDEIY